MIMYQTEKAHVIFKKRGDFSGIVIMIPIKWIYIGAKF